MTPKRPRLLFDENFGEPYVEALRQFVACNPHGVPVEVRHVFELFQPGTEDEVWIPAIAQDDYILLSSDRHKRRGAQKKRGKPLPRLCVTHGIRHVLLSGGMAQQKMFDKFLAILGQWYAILDIADCPPGTRFQFEPDGRGRGKLIEKLRPASAQPLKSQHPLFNPSNPP